MNHAALHTRQDYNKSLVELSPCEEKGEHDSEIPVHDPVPLPRICAKLRRESCVSSQNAAGVLTLVY